MAGAVLAEPSGEAGVAGTSLLTSVVADGIVGGSGELGFGQGVAGCAEGGGREAVVRRLLRVWRRALMPPVSEIMDFSTAVSYSAYVIPGTSHSRLSAGRETLAVFAVPLCGATPCGRRLFRSVE